MNTDRCLTRVWDKQEKKMLYSNDQIKTHFCDSDDYRKRYLGICLSTSGEVGLSCIVDDNTGIYPTWEEFGDRFIPMLCLGNPDKNKKLIYAGDIIATSNNNKYLVYREEESAAFWFKRLDNESEIFINDFGCEIKIIGNIHENPELLEQNQL